MMAIAEWAPERRRPTFSFYVTAHRCKRNPQMVETAVDLADAVTVAGPEGPEVIRRLRESGFQAPALFDGMGYAGKDLPRPDDWVGVQRGVGAVRRLLPGALLAWDRSDDSEFIVAVQEQDRIAAGLAATMLLAIDVRWVARRTDLVVETLRSADQPAALVLIHRGDRYPNAGPSKACGVSYSGSAVCPCSEVITEPSVPWRLEPCTRPSGSRPRPATTHRLPRGPGGVRDNRRGCSSARCSTGSWPATLPDGQPLDRPSFVTSPAATDSHLLGSSTPISMPTGTT